MSGVKRAALLIAVLLLGLANGLPAQAPDQIEHVLIRVSKPYAPIVARVQSVGGTVTHQYRYVDAIAADVPFASVGALRDLVGTAALSKDQEIRLPRSGDAERGRRLAGGVVQPQVFADSVKPLAADDLVKLAGSMPQAYLLNNNIANASPLHAKGIAGQGVVVALIDTGIRPGFPISTDGSVIGCEDFVGDGLGCSNTANFYHGTFVAGMVSSNVVFTFSTASAIRNAVLAECPSCFADPPTNTQIPMIGTAPLSSLYALRVFGPSGAGPASHILAAMERAIELREKYNAGDPGGVKITIANMSLGGETVFPGGDLLDQMANVLLDHDILPVIAAGNTGPASITVGSPGTATGALTVGAASLSHNERILDRVLFGPTVGALYHPFLGHQTAFFSSRGPDANGQPDPDVVMNGVASFGQGDGPVTSITFGDGTRTPHHRWRVLPPCCGRRFQAPRAGRSATPSSSARIHTC
jgi:subtilisin family serine protease